MFKILDGLFPKSKPATVSRPATPPADIAKYVSDIAEFLQIDAPDVGLVDLLFESNYLNGLRCPQRYVQMQITFRPEELPKDIAYLGAHYQGAGHPVLLARKFPKVDRATGQITIVDLTLADQVFILIHELRHIWQEKYHASKYYGHNAVGLEHIHDPAEVDADAFALAYVLSDRTPFCAVDMPSSMSEFRLKNKYDGGKRRVRAKALAKEAGCDFADILTAVRG